MKVGILGSGDVAKALAAGFIKHGHQVTLGTRDTGKLKDFLAQHKGVQAASFAETDVRVAALAGDDQTAWI